MRLSTALLAILFLHSPLFPADSTAQSGGSIRGTVLDAESARPLAGAHVLVTSLRDPGDRAGEYADGGGNVSFEDLVPGKYEVRVTHVGYKGLVLREIVVVAGETTSPVLRMSKAPLPTDEMVITASRREERALDAPAAVQVVDTEVIENRSVLTTADHLQGLRAVDVARAGLNQGTVVIRGFNNIFSGTTLMLVDHRIARVPSLRYNAFNLIPTVNEDIEQIEIVSGPGSALYGPNTANGVLHIRTRSPFDAPGTSFSTALGGRRIALVSGRHADAPSESFAYKIAASYYVGDDFETTDPVEIQALIDARERDDPDTAKIAQRSFDVEKLAVEGRVDLRPSSDLHLTFNAGVNQLSAIELTGLGAVQAENWASGYGQLRLRWKELFWQSYVNGSNAGNTYNLRTGGDLVDDSKVFVSQAQHQWTVNESQAFVYGVDLLLTRPSTDGTIIGRNENDDDINELGAFVQSETRAGPAWKFVAAARVDDHNHLEDPVFSPRAAVVFGPEPNHKLRATYNRAFSTPTANNLFLDLVVLEDLGGLGALVGGEGYDVFTKGVPSEGFTFRRDDFGGLDGLYMQVPQGLGGTADHIPADATLTWGTIQALIPPVAMIPAPTPEQVETVLRVVNPTTAEFDSVDAAYVQDIARIKPTITNTFEIGYKGIVAQRFVTSVDVWHRRIKDFVGPLRVETPNVFFDPTTLRSYLAGFGISGPQLDALTEAIAAIPVGAVTPDGTEDPADLMLTYRNFGDVDLTGVDFSVEWLAYRNWSFGLSYSYVNRDFFEDASGISDIALNAPQHKAGGLVRYADARRGLDAGVRVRFVDTFPVLSGAFTGEIDQYTLFDLTAAYDLPMSRGTTISLTVQNLFDDPHREFVGAPKLGRVSMLRLTQAL